ncbi:MAG: D-glycero-beta-D-manno-heptose-7-phosphate kinase [Candidatus Protistobacter heckmanni]|nr:D-glycero-beta-D-manno-heptose-7-phosphate kinase [Candidatus Protistobacter heckmanni]
MSNASSAERILDLSQARVLIAGDIMLDRYLFGSAERISPEAPVPVVLVRKTESRLGGAANVARNAASIGAKVGLVGIIGDDEPGRSVDALLAEAGIARHLEIEPGRPTTVKQRVLAQQQQLLRLDFEQTPAQEAVDASLETFESVLPDYDVAVLSDYGKGGLANVARKIALMRAAGKKVLVDPKGEDYSRYRGATLVTPNRAELRRVVGVWRTEADLHIRAQNLRRELSLEALLLTRSEEGMTLFAEAEVVHVQAEAREVFDVSGAGDTVAAVLAVLLATGMPLKEAVQHANRAGGIVVGKLGTATVTREELFGTAP